MSFLAPIAAGALASGVGSAVGSFFGGDAPTVSFTPPGINAGGLDARFKKNQYRVTPSEERMGYVTGTADLFGEQAGLINALRRSVAPGMSDLRASRLAEIENARLAAIGNLRDNLARRRVLGSSFGNDAIARAESEFGQQRERVAAESFLQELDTTTRLISDEFQTRRSEFNTYLDELNLETNVALGLAGKATDALAQNAQMEARLAAMSSQGAGTLFGYGMRLATGGSGTPLMGSGSNAMGNPTVNGGLW